MEQDNMQAVIDAARKGVEVTNLSGATHYKVFYTPSHGVQEVGLEKYLETPFRKKGTVWVYDADSFNHLLAENHVAGATTVYINPDADKPAIVAVINGNGSAGPGFGDFRVSMSFRPTQQWTKWRGIDGKLLPQAEFAEFVEDNLADVAVPDGATMMEIVTYLQATRSVDFRSGIKLSNGAVQLTNNESVEAHVGAGNIAVPDMFEIALSPIFGVQLFKVPARFRYRIEDRRLKLGFKLQRIEDIVERIVQEIAGEIDAIDGVGKIYGQAPA